MKNNIKKYRQEKGLTQKELAGKINISERALQNYENGERTPNVITAQRIASALGEEIQNIFPISE